MFFNTQRHFFLFALFFWAPLMAWASAKTEEYLPHFHIIGTMSGTSMDGVDVTLLETDGEGFLHEQGHVALAYPPLIQKLLKATAFVIQHHKGDLHQVNEHLWEELKTYATNHLGLSNSDALQFLQDASFDVGVAPQDRVTLDHVINHLTRYHSDAISLLCSQLKWPLESIDAIGCHGQTFYHNPSEKITLQLINASQLARDCGRPVIWDFRREDVRSGGQGAPLAPAYHLALVKNASLKEAVVLNCGGISNATVIPSSLDIQDVRAFDIGPGNGLLDRFVAQRTQGKETMDQGGHYSSQGKVHPEVLTALFQKGVIRQGENYFHLPSPKSLDIHDLVLVPELEALSLEDGCRTLAAFTAEAITWTLHQHLKEGKIKSLPHIWILAGGGCYNQVILQELKDRLLLLTPNQTPITVKTADEIGWNNKGVEANIFAYLAVHVLQGKPLSFSHLTGVPTAMTGGVLTLPKGGNLSPAVVKLLKDPLPCSKVTEACE
jgi:anhydro-N-acetylmuramic acid kinase